MAKIHRLGVIVGRRGRMLNLPQIGVVNRWSERQHIHSNYFTIFFSVKIAQKVFMYIPHQSIYHSANYNISQLPIVY